MRAWVWPRIGSGCGNSEEEKGMAARLLTRAALWPLGHEYIGKMVLSAWASIGNSVWKPGDCSRVGVDAVGSVSVGINTDQSNMGASIGLASTWRF